MAELEQVVTAQREKEYRHHKFLAALKGVDLDAENKESAQDRVEQIKREIEAERAGKTVHQLDIEDMGIKFETE